MGMREYIINDSSLYLNKRSMIEKDYSIRVGMVREHIYLPESDQTRYIVEIWKENKLYPITCTRTSRFGGLYNYEEYNYRGFTPGSDNAGFGNFEVAPGDMVTVAAVNGNSREGIILGSINHTGRAEVLPATGEQGYVSEFNGLQTMINQAGEYRITFKGKPTNLKALSVAPNGERYADPKYNEDVGFSYYEFDKDGSFLLTDNATDELPQSIRVDKALGQIIVTSGKTVLTIDKAEESYAITNKKTTIDSADEFNLNTKSTVVKSADLFSVEAKDVKTKGKLTQEGDTEITGATKITGKTDVTGNFSTTGQTKLAGGEHALVYDVILSKGEGNLGGPVISQIKLLKTTKTKAS